MNRFSAARDYAGKTKMVVSSTAFPDVDDETFQAVLTIRLTVKPKNLAAYRKGYAAFFQPETLVHNLTPDELEGYKEAQKLEEQRRNVYNELVNQTLNRSCFP